jgi:hypothetical protein
MPEKIKTVQVAGSAFFKKLSKVAKKLPKFFQEISKSCQKKMSKSCQKSQKNGKIEN